MLLKRSFFLIIACALLLSACGGAAGDLNTSIQAWVEYPYEGSTLPMQPTQLIVYATAPDGISRIDVKVNGQPQPASAVQPLTTDGGSRLVRVDVNWMPPGEGQYVVEAAGVNTAGATGGSSSTYFCIVTCDPSQTPTPTPTPAPAESDSTGTPTPAALSETETPSPAPASITNTPTPSGEMKVEFYTDPKTIEAGGCATLHWLVDSPETISVYLDGSLVGTSGNSQVCTCQNETHGLRVKKANGSLQDYSAIVNVIGSCSVEQPPIDSPPLPPASTTDTTGPTVNSVDIYWPQEGCSLFGRANITDPSGVIWGEFWFNLNENGWAWIKMNQSGDQWTSQVGIDTAGLPGSVEYKVRTEDSLNNESWSGTFTKNFAYCGD